VTAHSALGSDFEEKKQELTGTGLISGKRRKDIPKALGNCRRRGRNVRANTGFAAL